MLLVLGSIMAAWLLTRLAGRRAFDAPLEGDDHRTLRITYVVLPLVFSFEAGFHLERFLTLAGQVLTVLGRQLALAIQLPGYSVPLPAIRFIQSLLILAGATGSAIVLTKNLTSDNEKRTPLIKQSWPIIGLSFLYLCFFLGS